MRMRSTEGNDHSVNFREKSWINVLLLKGKGFERIKENLPVDACILKQENKEFSLED